MENYIEDEELENEEYNYKEEAEKIKKDKKIIFYDDDIDIEDKRYFSIIPAELKEIDESEKLLSNCINKKCKYNKTLEKAKEIFINTISQILDEEIEIKEDKKMVSISSYELSLYYTALNYHMIVN